MPWGLRWNSLAGGDMSTPKLTGEDLAHIEELAARWGKMVVKHQWGDQGPGLDVTLDQMEQVAMAAVRGLLAGTLETATAQQAQQLGDQQPCPDCQRLCPLTTEERPVITGTGSFHHREPTGHCPACRRAFFPPTATVGVDQSRV